jgi:uncharacterized membrane protein
MRMNTLWYFFIYSFAGFVLECLFARWVGAASRSRKCLLLLPLCPVYGLGAVCIVSLPAAVRSSPALLFLFGALSASAAEYAMGLFYKKVWGVSFWSYEGLPGSVRGLVCLPFSAAWGALSLMLVYAVHPLASGLIPYLDINLLAGLVSLFVADTLVTTLLLRRTGRLESLRWWESDATEDVPARE